MLKNFAWCKHLFAKPTRKQLLIERLINFCYIVSWTVIWDLILSFMLLVRMCYVVCLERIPSIRPETMRHSLHNFQRLTLLLICLCHYNLLRSVVSYNLISFLFVFSCHLGFPWGIVDWEFFPLNNTFWIRIWLGCVNWLLQKTNSHFKRSSRQAAALVNNETIRQKSPIAIFTRH